MKITEVKIRRVFDETVLKAVVSATFDECFTVHDIKIIYVNSGYLVVMPNRKGKDGRISDVCHPINREFRKMLEDEVLSEYKSYLEETNADK